MTVEHQPVDAVIEQVTAMRDAYAEHYHATESPAIQMLIESHIEPLDHVLLMLEEVRDTLRAEEEWGMHDGNAERSE